MNKPRFILFIALLGSSGLAAYFASSHEPAKRDEASSRLSCRDDVPKPKIFEA
jgi:hypothetical protein